MKNKKLFLSLIAIVLLAAVLTCTLTACLKIGMKEENLIKRLKNHGASVSYERSSPITPEWQSKGISIKDILLAAYTEGEGEVVDGSTLDEEGDEEEQSSVSVTVRQTLYVFYCNDKESGDWVEDKCKAYKADEQNGETVKNWNIYRYDNVVMIGDYQLLAVARQY